MMRITNKMMVNSLNRNIAGNLQRMAEYQTQLSTTRRINKPSDDPAGVVKALRLRTNLVEGEQYLSNINESIGFMETTDAAFNDVTQIMHKVRELTVKAATDTNSQTDWEAISKEIRELNEQLKMIANATFGSKYIFAGSNVTEAPCAESDWTGNNQALEAEIGVGVIIPYNIDTKEFFSGRLDGLNVEAASGYDGDKMIAKNLQEGDYKVNNSLGTASEVDNKLNATSNTGRFFFYDDGGTAKAATTVAGSAAGNVDSVYNGALRMQVTGVDDAADTITVNLSGKISIGSGAYRDIEVIGVTLDMAALDGAAICTIDATDLGGPQDLVIWNNSGTDMTGIDANQFVAGDTVNLALSSVQSCARESQSFLTAVPNSGSFFYEAQGVEATLGVGIDNGAAPLANDSPYSGSILLETTRIEEANGSIGPRASLTGVNNGATATLSFTKALYQKDDNGNMAAVPDGDLKASFIYKRANGAVVSGAITAANYNAATGQMVFTFDNDPANGTSVQEGDTIVWNNDWNPATGEEDPGENKLYDRYGNEYQFIDDDGNENQPFEFTYKQGADSWVYDDKYQSAKAFIDIKAHLYTTDGHYKYVEMSNVEVDMETAAGDRIFRIPASAINDPNFTEDLIIWNNGNDTLGGIDPDTSQLKVGDKTVISITAQGQDDSQNANINFTYTTAAGEEVVSNNRFKFDAGTFDYHTRKLRIFSLNEQTGLAYSGEISMETEVFGAKDDAATFSWQEGLFGFMEDLARKIEAGKVTETSMQLEGSDIRLQELLTYRSTVGARINRLELQQSRLESSNVTITDLLSKTEDADMAEVIMQLQLQENVYKASLAAGARIIQPSLLDFLS